MFDLATSGDLDLFPSEEAAAPAAPAPSDPAGDPIGNSSGSTTQLRSEPGTHPGSVVVGEFQPRGTELIRATALPGPASQDEVDLLKLEHSLLREASATFGALAERLTKKLAERRLDDERRGVSVAEGPVTLVDLLEHAEGLSWREAVAIVYRLCLALRNSTKQSPVLLEPRNVEITSDGTVRVVPGQICGDALVVQLGRLLRRLLSDAPTPPELRLLIAQATFELPIFESVDDLARALLQLDRIEDPAGVRAAFVRATHTGTPQQLDARPEKPVAAGRTILPTRRVRGRKRGSRAGDSGFDMEEGLIAAALIGVAVILAWTLTPASWRGASPSSGTLPAQRIVAAAEPNVVGSKAIDPPTAVPPASPTSPPATVAQPPARAGRADDRSVARAPGSAAVNPRAAVSSAAAAPSIPERPAARPDRTTGRVMAAPAPEDLANRAAGLIEEGKMADASTVFDALVFTYPLYEPDPNRLTAAALTMLGASRRLLLPRIAARDYDRAKDALAGGDVDGALDLGRQVSAILQRLDPSAVPPELDGRVRRLLSEATAVRSIPEQTVYSGRDVEVVPPRPLSRQLPAAPPFGVPHHRIGVLDMVIGTRGDVEVVKLHTPLNRYHERMIVSAAKAWRYRPALKEGKPVRFRLSILVNLPESGSPP
jgi:hypothetical protein